MEILSKSIIRLWLSMNLLAAVNMQLLASVKIKLLAAEEGEPDIGVKGGEAK
jgi:hypothetical protein